MKPGVLDSIVDAPHRAGNSAHNVTTQADQQTETIDDPRYYLYEPTLKNTTQTQIHRLSLSTWYMHVTARDDDLQFSHSWPIRRVM
jgi:hypothetical protein